MTAINIIDASLHVSAFPATYVAPGLLQALGVSATPGSTSGTLSANAPVGSYGPAGDTYTLLIGNILQGPDADVIAGNFTGAGNLVVIPVGFAPSNIEVINWTGVIKWQWMAGAPSTDTLKTVTGGTTTADTTSAITVVTDAAGGGGDVCYIVLSAALAVSTDVISFRIEQ